MNKKTIYTLEFNKILEMLSNLCISKLAKDRAINLKIDTNREKIKKKQLETEQGYNFLVKSVNFSIGKIGNIKEYIDLILKGVIFYNYEILEIYDTLRSAKKIKNSILALEKEENIDILINESDKISIFKKLDEIIEKTIKSEDEVFDDASEKLYDIRMQIKEKNLLIRSKIDSLLLNSEIQKYLQDNVIAFKEGHYTLAVKQEFKNRIKGIICDESSSGQTVYIEPIEIVNITNDIRTLQLEEKKEIHSIFKKISEIIKENSTEILNTYFTVVNLDFILAKSRLAMQMNAINPNISDDNYMELRKARHPLIDKEKIVPIDFFIGKKFKSLLITGPNTGGKTVTLKTVGLLSLMFQSGLHIPASSATMPIFNDVFADIGDEQSIEQSLSTFSSHLTNIISILKKIDEKSLCLFDELGAGTDPTEGAALAISILNYIYDKGATSVVTTHYSELKKYALITDGYENAAVEFDVETLSPTYKLSIGVIGKSNAFEISKKLGLPDIIIKKSKNYIENNDIKFEDLIRELEEDRVKILKLKEETVLLKKYVEEEKIKFEDERNKFNEKINERINKAKEEAKLIIKNSREEAIKLLDEVKNLDKINQTQTLKIKTKFKELENKNTVIYEKQDIKGEIPKNLKLGQSVLVSTLNKEANIISLPDEKGNLNVQIGLIRYPVNINDLRVIDKENININVKNSIYQRNGGKKVTNSGSKINAKRNASIEIDLRGFNVDDAKIELDKYFDDAMLSGYKVVTVIHGIGTGALKAGLKDFIKKHTHVLEAREGTFGEGGAGVTIVTLV